MLTHFRRSEREDKRKARHNLDIDKMNPLHLFFWGCEKRFLLMPDNVKLYGLNVPGSIGRQLFYASDIDRRYTYFASIHSHIKRHGEAHK